MRERHEYSSINSAIGMPNAKTPVMHGYHIKTSSCAFYAPSNPPTTVGTQRNYSFSAAADPGPGAAAAAGNAPSSAVEAESQPGPASDATWTVPADGSSIAHSAAEGDAVAAAEEVLEDAAAAQEDAQGSRCWRAPAAPRARRSSAVGGSPCQSRPGACDEPSPLLPVFSWSVFPPPCATVLASSSSSAAALELGLGRALALGLAS